MTDIKKGIAAKFNLGEFFEVVKKREPEIMDKLPQFIEVLNYHADCHKKAEEIVKNIDNIGLEGFVDMPMIDGLTLLNVMILTDDKARKQAKSLIPQTGGLARAENDERHQRMVEVKNEYLEKWKAGYRFPRGTLRKFYDEMAIKHELDFSAIKNSIEKYRKKLGHSLTKKQSS